MQTDDETDEAFMLCYQAGDADAFTRLYTRHRGPLYRYLLRQCGQPAIAEELFQDVWLKVIAARAGYTVQARFSAWLYRIAHNRLMDYYRASARSLPFSSAEDCPEWAEIPAAQEVQPEVQHERYRQAERLLELLAALPPAQREVILLKEEGNLSLEEIAQVTGTGRETVKSRLRYALARLRQGLGGLS